MTQQVVSYQLAESIDVKGFSTSFHAELYYNDPAELFYRIHPDQYAYVFKYGAVCFLNLDKKTIDEVIRQIRPFCKNIFANYFTDEFIVETGAKELRVGFNKIEIPSTTVIDILRLVMLNVSQSVALDYYEDQTNRLLEETNTEC